MIYLILKPERGLGCSEITWAHCTVNYVALINISWGGSVSIFHCVLVVWSEVNSIYLFIYTIGP